MADIKPFFRGDTKYYRFKLRDKEGNPISVDGGKLTLTLKAEKDLPDSEASLQVSVAGVEADPANPTGEVSLRIGSPETDLEPGKYFYDFQFTTTSNDVFTVLPQDKDSGRVTVKSDVTRAE